MERLQVMTAPLPHCLPHDFTPVFVTLEDITIIIQRGSQWCIAHDIAKLAGSMPPVFWVWIVSA